MAPPAADICARTHPRTCPHQSTQHRGPPSSPNERWSKRRTCFGRLRVRWVAAPLLPLRERSRAITRAGAGSDGEDDAGTSSRPPKVRPSAEAFKETSRRHLPRWAAAHLTRAATLRLRWLLIVTLFVPVRFEFCADSSATRRVLNDGRNLKRILFHEALRHDKMQYKTTTDASTPSGDSVVRQAAHSMWCMHYPRRRRERERRASQPASRRG